MLRTILAKFYVEVSYGFLRTCDPVQGWGRASGSFNALIYMHRYNRDDGGGESIAG